MSVVIREASGSCVDWVFAKSYAGLLLSRDCHTMQMCVLSYVGCGLSDWSVIVSLNPEQVGSDDAIIREWFANNRCHLETCRLEPKSGPVSKI